jgi:hypothetical protein
MFITQPLADVLERARLDPDTYVEDIKIGSQQVVLIITRENQLAASLEVDDIFTMLRVSGTRLESARVPDNKQWVIWEMHDHPLTSLGSLCCATP